MVWMNEPKLAALVRAVFLIDIKPAIAEIVRQEINALISPVLRNEAQQAFKNRETIVSLVNDHEDRILYLERAAGIVSRGNGDQ